MELCAAPSGALLPAQVGSLGPTPAAPSNQQTPWPCGGGSKIRVIGPECPSASPRRTGLHPAPAACPQRTEASLPPPHTNLQPNQGQGRGPAREQWMPPSDAPYAHGAGSCGLPRHGRAAFSVPAHSWAPPRVPRKAGPRNLHLQAAIRRLAPEAIPQVVPAPPESSAGAGTAAWHWAHPAWKQPRGSWGPPSSAAR